MLDRGRRGGDRARCCGHRGRDMVGMGQGCGRHGAGAVETEQGRSGHGGTQQTQHRGRGWGGRGGNSTHQTRPADPPAPRWRGQSLPASLLPLCTCWPGAGSPAMRAQGAWTAPGTDMGGERRDRAKRGTLLLPLTRFCPSAGSVLSGCGHGWHSAMASSGSSHVSLASSQHPPVSHHPSVSHPLSPCVLP